VLVKRETVSVNQLAKTSAQLSIFSCSISATITSRMERISLPVEPLDSRERITDLDIMKKESVRNRVLSECLYRGASHSPLYNLVVEHVAIDFDHIYLGVIITHPIKSLCIRTNAITEGLIITTLTGKVIQTLIITDPESNIPGLIIRPTVIGGVGHVGLESGSHLGET